MPIEGSIAEVLDTYTVVINRGSEDGVNESAEFLIYRTMTPMDPEGERDLGSFEIKKAKIVPKEIYERMSVMETETTYSEVDLTKTNFSNLTPFRRTVSNQDELNTDEDVEDNIEKVSVGDSVREIIEDDSPEDSDDPAEAVEEG